MNNDTPKDLRCWEDAFLSAFGKRKKHQAEEIVHNLLAIACGVKPAYLWDLVQPVSEKVRHFLCHLKKFNRTAQPLQVLILGQDLFVTRLDHLVTHLQQLIGEDVVKIYMIDVSESLASPQLVGRSTQSEVKESLENIISQLCSFESTADGAGQEECSVYNIAVGEGWNLTTIFGAFLGYPASYWYDNANSDGNCLSMCPLHVYLVKLGVSSEVDGKPKKVEHALYSFSIPENLVPGMSDVVDNWFSDLLEKCKLVSTFKLILCATRTVCLPAVAL